MFGRVTTPAPTALPELGKEFSQSEINANKEADRLKAVRAMEKFLREKGPDPFGLHKN